MKQGISKNLTVTVDYDNSLISKIEFIFKQQRSNQSKILKSSTYAKDGTGDVTYSNGVYLIPFSASETYSFTPSATFYMDTRISLTGSNNNPETEMVTLRMNDTLFGS